MEGTFLAVVDADRIQDYIFAPRQLKLIRGASAIQRDLNLRYSLELLRNSGYGPGNVDPGCDILDEGVDRNPGQKWEVVYAGGGNLYALFRESRAAEEVADDICALYRKHGVTASATAAVAPWAGTFRETLQNAQAKVTVRKTAVSAVADPISRPYWRASDACGGAPATHWARNPVTGERMLCRACEARRGRSEHAPYLDEIGTGLKPPRDFEAIAETARPESYLGLVYLDVDQLGRYFDNIDPLPPELYRRHSLRIQSTVKDGVIAGCRAACETGTIGSAAPFEILLMGGDDAVVMLAAQLVFPFLKRFREVFQRELTALTFSAGIVWAHHHLPISQYVHHARRLLRSAKAEGGGRVDYLVVSESMVRERDESARHTLRPYTLEGFDNLYGTIRDWKGARFPSSKAHQLYSMAFEEEDQGALDFLYWLSRLEEHHRAAACRFFGQDFWQRQPRRATGAADLAELWDFVEAV